MNPNTKIQFYTPQEHKIVVDLLPLMVNDGVLKNNFILYGGDLVSNINIFEVIDFHHLSRATLTTVLLKDLDFEKKKSLPFYSPQENSMVYGLECESMRILTALPNYQLKEEGLNLKTSILSQ